MSKALVVAQVFAYLATTVGGAAYAQEIRLEHSEAESRVEARLRVQPPGRDTQRVWTLESSRLLGPSRALKWQAGDASVLLHYTLHDSAAAAKAALRSDVNSINGGGITVSITGVGDEAFLTDRGAMLFRRGRLTASVRAPGTMAYQISQWLLAELNREHLGSGDKNDPDLP